MIRRAALWLYRLELDLLLEQWVAHHLGWHTTSCRGRMACAPWPLTRGMAEPASHGLRRRGWYRWLP